MTVEYCITTSVDVPTSDSGADVNGSPVKKSEALYCLVSGVDDMINKASSVNRDVLDSEF